MTETEIATALDQISKDLDDSNAGRLVPKMVITETRSESGKLLGYSAKQIVVRVFQSK